MTDDDATLLRRFATERSGAVFTELVRRHLPLVYSAALRRLGGDAHRAEDIAQTVFCTLARDAGRLATHPALVAWLYTATRNEATTQLRAENRRRLREHSAHIMHETSLETDPAADWSRLRPVLDTAMDGLNERDRAAVLLRFFQGLPFAAVGAALGSTEEAARKRVDRALEKLRELLRAHGITSTSAALGALLTSQGIAATPAGLATTIAGTALAPTAVASAATGIGASLAMTKIQIGVAAAVLVAGGLGLVTQQHRVSTLQAERATAEAQVARLSAENAHLARLRAASDAELARLRAEAQSPPVAAPLSPPAAPLSRRVSSASASSGPDASSIAVADDAGSQATKAALHRRYDPFLQKHGLTQAQAERFVALKIAIADAQADLQAALRQAGATAGTPEVEAMRSQLVKPLWGEIRALLGESGYRDYGVYEQSSAFRLGYVEPMLPQFEAANAALSPQQADALVRIFAANSRAVRVNPSDLGSTGITDWDAVLTQAGATLTPAQSAVLETFVNRRKAAHSTR